MLLRVCCDDDEDGVVAIGANADATGRVGSRQNNAAVAATIVVIIPFATRRVDCDELLHPGGGCGFPSVRCCCRRRITSMLLLYFVTLCNSKRFNYYAKRQMQYI